MVYDHQTNDEAQSVTGRLLSDTKAFLDSTESIFESHAIDNGNTFVGDHDEEIAAANLPDKINDAHLNEDCRKREDKFVLALNTLLSNTKNKSLTSLMKQFKDASAIAIDALESPKPEKT
ncbi:hypothetical protein [Robiginitomaculum antarcticum]|uniref:hypothetical protein n=1 Tax=Robiginitomaculum antarcticum TaxID=437507 RepID=UPI00037E9601|nr:hypothetical protein [Robiginitomaculum antarcticum]